MVIGVGAFFEHTLRHGFQVADETGQREEFEPIISGIDFPPIETVARGALETVMIVMPAFAERDEGEDRAVAGIVVGFEAAFAHDVSHGIDAPGAVKEEGRADEETPNEHLPAGGAEGGGEGFEGDSEPEKGNGKEDRHDEIEAIEPDELGELREILDLRVVGREIAFAGDPADVRPPESMDMWRVSIFRLIAVLVVMAMMIGPPERTALHGGAGEDREEKLTHARSAVGFVREIAVMDASNRKHADEVERDRGPHCKGARADPDYTETAGVEEDEGHHAHPIDAIGFVAHFLGTFGAVIGVDPLHERVGSAFEVGGRGGLIRF